MNFTINDLTLLLLFFTIILAYVTIMSILMMRTLSKYILDILLKNNQELEKIKRSSKAEILAEVLEDAGVDGAIPIHPDFSNEEDVGQRGRFKMDRSGNPVWEPE